ncbi:MAG: oxidoreductase [Glaciihabitans sp.]|nr:oxidoreductase [Glaciihabitans sp.]
MPLTLPTPRYINPDTVPSLRWGVVGTGSIATKFVRALRKNTSQRLVAVAARSPERTARFAVEFEIPAVFATVEELVADTQVDVVYVATPHSSHRDVALLAIAAGKHVLIEKPIAVSAGEAREIVAAARVAGVFVMEAMWTRYLPQTDIIRQLIADETLGEIHLVQADFGFRAPFDPSSRMFDPALGGGALLDAGVYPISFASFAIGKAVTISAAGAVTSTGVDTRAVLSIGTADGAKALLATSIVSRTPTRAAIIGSDGRVEVTRPFYSPSGLEVSFTVNGVEETTSWRDDRFDAGFHALSYQAIALAAYVAAGRTESPVHSLDETVSILATIDEARRQILAPVR